MPDTEPSEPSSPTSPGEPSYTEPSTTTGILPVSSPTYLPDFGKPDFTPGDEVPTGPLVQGSMPFKLEDYPTIWAVPEEGHPEIKIVMENIDWSLVPDLPQRKMVDGSLSMGEYDVGDDSGCWWSATGCTNPKVDYLPSDVNMCENAGDWALTFDDGPLSPRKDVVAAHGEDPYAAPYLYDYLATQSQIATMFYVGSNIAKFPEAAKRALDAGHNLCLHGWSHSPLTTLSNEQIVAELYWPLRALKEATSVTSKCWRPPYGDVDDRVRAIAHQMGLKTVLWDRDSQDWQLESMTNKGLLSPETVDGYFETWIAEGTSGNETHGHIGLQHELNEVVIGLAEKWLPKLKETFQVKPVHKCIQIGSPYWELD